MPPSNKRVPAIRFSGFVEEWKENKVADLAERFYGGGTPSTIASEYWGGETAWIQSSDLGEGELFNVVPKRKVTLKALKETNIQLIPANSIAVVTRVGVGKLALMEYSYTTSQDFCSLANLRANPAMLSYLLYLELNYKGVSVQGTAIKGITKNDLDSINLFIPDGRSEQSRIGQFFRTLDKLIELRKKKLDKLIALKKELLNKLFPQQGQKIPAIRFSSFVEEWKEVALGELAGLITKGTTPLEKRGKGEINFIKVESIDPLSGKIYVKTRISRKEHDGFLKRSKLKENDILFSIAGTLGRVCCVPSEILPANTNQALAIIRVEKADVKFLTVALNGRMTAEYIRCNPTIGAQPNLSLKQVGELPICHPNIGEQSRIGQFFRTLDKLIELRKKEVDKMIALKKKLLNKLFVG